MKLNELCLLILNWTLINKTLEDYQIQNNSIIYFFPLAFGGDFNFDIFNIEDKLNKLRNYFTKKEVKIKTITLYSPFDGELSFEVPANINIEDLKKNKEKKLNIPIKQQILIACLEKSEEFYAFEQNNPLNSFLKNSKIFLIIKLEIFQSCPEKFLLISKKSQNSLNFNYESNLYQSYFDPTLTIKGIKSLIMAFTHLKLEDLVIFDCKNSLIDFQENLFCSKYFSADSQIMVVPASKGGRSIQFTQLVSQTQIENLDSMVDSLSFIPKLKQLKDFMTCREELLMNKPKNIIKSIPDEALISVYLWTTDILYRELNLSLSKLDSLEK